MEWPRDLMLALAVLATFALGFVPIIKLDRFLDVHRKSLEREQEKRLPSRVLLTDEMTDEEIAAELRQFRSQHDIACIVLCDRMPADQAEDAARIAGRNQ